MGLTGLTFAPPVFPTGTSPKTVFVAAPMIRKTCPQRFTQVTLAYCPGEHSHVHAHMVERRRLSQDMCALEVLEAPVSASCGGCYRGFI